MNQLTQLMFFNIDLMFDTTNSFLITVLALINKLSVSISRLLIIVFIVTGSLLAIF